MQTLTYEEFMTDPIRERSPELDFGVLWRRLEQTWPTYRISWIQNTGELYAVQNTDLPDSSRTCVVLGVFKTKDDVEKAMKGWTEPGFTVFGMFANGGTG